MKTTHKLLMLLAMTLGLAQAGEMRFDQHGNMLMPDHTYLTQGLKDLEQGYENDAMRNLLKAAEFGNPYAQATIAYVHLQQKQHIKALAWFQLIDLSMIEKEEAIVQKVEALQAHLSADDQRAADELLVALKKDYGKSATLAHRLDWQNSISFGGTRLKGKLPGRITVYPAARIEKKGLETEIFVSPVSVSGQQVQQQMDQFVFEYELRFTEGRVRIGELELNDQDMPI
jgi:hypothetical protein